MKNDALDWIESLHAETKLLEDLAALAANTRRVRPDTDPKGFAQLLSAQAELCDRVAALRTKRAEHPSMIGRGERDLLSVVMAALPKAEHPSALDAFRVYMETAVRADEEIGINREFFAVAQAAIDETIDAITGARRRTGMYDKAGHTSSAATGLCVSIAT